MISQFVKHTDGSYISGEVLPYLIETQGRANRIAKSDALQSLNLNQTLDDIESDIIRIVLEEENNNQSNAAKRLGINRSTLWRKLKDQEEDTPIH